MQKLTLKLIVISLLTLLAATSANAQRVRACCSFTLPTWNGSFIYQGTPYPYTMIGGDPANGGTTSIGVEIIPIDLQFVDSNGKLVYELNINTPMCNSANTGVTLTLNSPLFQNYPFYMGGSPDGTFVGNTQYTDAFQRATFWNQASVNDYHVLLGGVTVQPVQSVIVFPADGSAAPSGPCTQNGIINYGFFDNAVRNLVTSLAIPSNVLPIFLVRNAEFLIGTNLYYDGWHGMITSTSNTYIVAAFYDPDIYGSRSIYQDTYFLSHELAEWMDDPHGNNPTPAWSGGQVQSPDCQTNLEVGDPLTGSGFTASLNGFNYHLTNLAMLPWFSRETPSSAVNGWYTFPLSVYPTPSTC